MDFKGVDAKFDFNIDSVNVLPFIPQCKRFIKPNTLAT